MISRHSKIVCTIGPVTRTPRMIRKLIDAGMDVARLNFSHGTHEEHAQNIAALREAAVLMKKPIAILADLQGPKIRTGALAGGGSVSLRTGQKFVITTAKVLGDSTRVNTTFRPLPHEVKADDRILLSDGLIELRVERLRGHEVHCHVVNGGILGEHKGINLPGVQLRVPALTEKDRQDLRFALKQGVDYIAVSFVRRAEDVVLAKTLIKRAKKDTPVIAKLEKPEAIENLEEILRVADGVMVARGDLGVEMNPERVPVVQKNIIARAREFRRPVITATQMLESMTENPRPTRAEASDVANAIFDGSDAVMLSAETATGRYPVEAVSMMARIIEQAEESIHEYPRPATQERLKVPETVAELDCDFHAQRIYGAAGVTLPTASADCGVFSGSAHAATNGAVVGCHLAEHIGYQENRWAGNDCGKAADGRAAGAQGRRHRDCGRNADGYPRHDELHEIPCNWEPGVEQRMSTPTCWQS
jgi:pyruvate kinase